MISRTFFCVWILSPGSPLHTVLGMDLLNILLQADFLSPGSPLHTVLGNGSLEYTFVCGFSHQVLLCIQLLVMDLLSKVFLHVDSLTRFAYACSYW
jgi:hypothetical protein